MSAYKDPMIGRCVVHSPGRPQRAPALTDFLSMFWQSQVGQVHCGERVPGHVYRRVLHGLK
jgi:hypothetical protein